MVKRCFKIFIVLFALIDNSVATAQVISDAELRNRLSGKSNFYEILSIVDSHYREKTADLAPGDQEKLNQVKRQVKFWNRWEYINRPRLGAKGELVDVTAKLWETNKARETEFVAASSYGQWNAIGPTSYTRIGSGHGGGLGRVNCIAFHPSNAAIIYIGAAYGGLWRSLTGGSSWVNLTDNIPSTAISGIVIDRVNPSIIYVLTGDGYGSAYIGNFVQGGVGTSIGVLKSTDGGLNWNKAGEFVLPSGIDHYYGYKLVQHPVNANILFAATSAGLYKSTDAGSSWSRKQGKTYDIEFHPGNPSIMYAAIHTFLSSVDIYRSVNSGDNWTVESSTGANRISLAVTPVSPNEVLAVAGPVTLNTTNFKGFFRSTDAGDNFSLVFNSPNILGGQTNGSDSRDQSDYDLAIAVSPQDATKVLIGGINIWGSTTSIATFVNRTHWVEDITPASKYVHADIHELAYNPLDNKVYACTDGGVAVSADNGVSWTPLWNGLQIMQFYHLGGYEADENIYIGGAQDNGTNYRKSYSNNIFHIEGADGYSSIIDYSNSNTVYLSANEALLRSLDGGSSISLISPSGSAFDNSWPFVAMNPVNNSIIYAGKRKTFYYSGNKGSTWDSLPGISSNAIVAPAPNNANRIYVAGGGDVHSIVTFGANKLYRIDISGSVYTATSLFNNSGFPPYDTVSMTDLAVHPANSGIVWASFGGFKAGKKVYRSTNAGASWSNVSGSLPNIAVTAIAIDGLGNVYAGTDLGVFYRGASMSDWVPFYNGLPKSPISDIVINNTTGAIVVSTFGRGLFQSTAYSDCIGSISLSGLTSGYKFYETSSTITSTQSIYGGLNTEIYLKAGNNITLNPGFEAKEGSFFNGYIGPCANGIPGQSSLFLNYKVSNASEIIPTEPVYFVPVAPIVKNAAELAELNTGNKKLTLTLNSDQYVQVYFEEPGGEILYWITRSALKAGVYVFEINDSKLRDRNIYLKIITDSDFFTSFTL